MNPRDRQKPTAPDAAVPDAAAPDAAAPGPPDAGAPDAAMPDPEVLLELCRYEMPFGKYKGRKLLHLPEAYLAWFKRNGMPNGKLGMLLETALVIRSSGLEQLVAPIAREFERKGQRNGK